MDKEVQKIIDDFCNSAQDYKKKVMECARKNAINLSFDNENISYDDFERAKNNVLDPETAYCDALDVAFDKRHALSSEKEDLVYAEMAQYRRRVRSQMRDYYREALLVIEDSAKQFCAHDVRLSKEFSSLSETAKNNIFDIVWHRAQMIEIGNSLPDVMVAFERLLESTDDVVAEVLGDISVAQDRKNKSK